MKLKKRERKNNCSIKDTNFEIHKQPIRTDQNTQTDGGNLRKMKRQNLETRNNTPHRQRRLKISTQRHPTHTTLTTQPTNMYTNIYTKHYNRVAIREKDRQHKKEEQQLDEININK